MPKANCRRGMKQPRRSHHWYIAAVGAICFVAIWFIPMRAAVAIVVLWWAAWYSTWDKQTQRKRTARGHGYTEIISGYPKRASNRFTCVAVQRPPRAVGTPRSFSAPASSRNDVAPFA